ncbi:hypothetical protein D6D10_09645 [Aureobasidium pullulans]|uniref:Uncharacterized protein n=1 Tax=Aureobasidium pullulans TaxID=5580 RepID=A0A4S9DZ64_AURPU|nr:hypothetical protein D6D10_09645 [Aureobasidium pullulans]
MQHFSLAVTCSFQCHANSELRDDMTRKFEVRLVLQQAHEFLQGLVVKAARAVEGGLYVDAKHHGCRICKACKTHGPPTPTPARDLMSIRNPVNHGARFEGDLFSALRHSPYVVRSFEFALVDGAVALDNTFDANSNYADRFWRIDQQQRNPDLRTENEMLYFDGKSSSSAVAEGQVFLTTIKQRRLVAFYVCICANDPRFVELIPNRY